MFRSLLQGFWSKGLRLWRWEKIIPVILFNFANRFLIKDVNLNPERVVICLHKMRIKCRKAVRCSFIRSVKKLCHLLHFLWNL